MHYPNDLPTVPRIYVKGDENPCGYPESLGTSPKRGIRIMWYMNGKEIYVTVHWSPEIYEQVRERAVAMRPARVSLRALRRMRMSSKMVDKTDGERTTGDPLSRAPAVDGMAEQTGSLEEQMIQKFVFSSWRDWETVTSQVFDVGKDIFYDIAPPPNIRDFERQLLPFLTLDEFLNPEQHHFQLVTIDNIPQIISAERVSVTGGSGFEEHPGLSTDYPFTFDPHLPCYSSQNLYVMPAHHSRHSTSLTLDCILADGQQMIFWRAWSLWAHEIHDIAKNLSWLAYTCGSIEREESFSPTEMLGYVKDPQNKKFEGVLFQYRGAWDTRWQRMAWEREKWEHDRAESLAG